MVQQKFLAANSYYGILINNKSIWVYKGTGYQMSIKSISEKLGKDKGQRENKIKSSFRLVLGVVVST